MKALTINIPDSLNIDEKEVRILLAAKLYERGTLSLGQAAELAGHSKRSFMEILADHDVSVFNYPVAELDKEILDAQDYHL
jgi:predicted HTH domain antitoxin